MATTRTTPVRYGGALALGLAVGLAGACGGEDEDLDDGAGGSTAASTTASGASVSSAAGTTGSASSSATTVAASSSSTGGMMSCDDEPSLGGYCGLIKPILEAKCTPCHSGATPGTCSGGHCSVDFYADTQKDSTVCVGKKLYECMLDRIKDGTMPQAKGCTGDALDDADNPACLSAADQIVFANWVSMGAPLE